MTPQQFEYEVEFARDGGDPGCDVYHVHVRCAAGRWAWPGERGLGGGRW